MTCGGGLDPAGGPPGPGSQRRRACPIAGNTAWSRAWPPGYTLITPVTNCRCHRSHQCRQLARQPGAELASDSGSPGWPRLRVVSQIDTLAERLRCADHARVDSPGGVQESGSTRHNTAKINCAGSSKPVTSTSEPPPRSWDEAASRRRPRPPGPARRHRGADGRTLRDVRVSGP